MRYLCRTAIHDVEADAWYSQIDPTAIRYRTKAGSVFTCDGCQGATPYANGILVTC